MVGEDVGFVEILPPSLCAYPPEFNLVRYHQVFSRTLRNVVTANNTDWLYQRMSLANFAGATVSRETNVPLVVEYNGSEAWISRNWGRSLRNEPFALAAEEAMLRQATLVVAVSEVLGDELRERGIPPERIFVHPNCVNPKKFRSDLLSPAEIRAKRGELGIANDALVVTFLGTFGPWHGVLFLASALKRLYAEATPWLEHHRVHFLLVGDGSHRKEVETMLAGLPRITFTGLVPQHEAPAHLAISEIYLSPHVHTQSDLRFFGSPTKIFEYMAMGRAILASELEQIGDILRPGLQARGGEPSGNETAVLFEPGDEDAFLLGLRRLVEQPALRTQLGHNARTKVLSEFTWDRYASRLLDRLSALA
jgi:glycosyltransferase involved in cell wall biosynthesis